MTAAWENFEDDGRDHVEFRREPTVNRFVLRWLPEFGEPEEIPIGEPTLHNGRDGRFVLSTREVPGG